MMTNRVVIAAMTTSALLLRASDRHCAGSISFEAAYTITAPSTAEGRYWMGPVRNSRMTAMVAAAASPLTWLVAPMSSLTAVRDPLAPTGMPWVNPAATLANPNASSSWSASTTSWWRAAKERAVRIESEKPTRKMPAAATASEATSDPLTSGTVSDGRPLGTGPVTLTPWDARSSAHDTAIPATTTISAAGIRRLMRPITMSSASDVAATATVSGLASPN